MNNIGEWQLRGIRQHYVMQFPIIIDKRKETFEETLKGLSSEEPWSPNYSGFPRTTYFYKRDLGLLQMIAEKVGSNEKFTSVEVQHDASDLGLTHRIKAEHNSGAVLFFDGLYVRITRVVTTDTFELKDLLPRTGVPHERHSIIEDFIGCVQKILPEQNIYGHSFYQYYTVDEANWEKLGLRREGDAQIRLVLNDPNFITITAIIFSTFGKDFHVYLGEEERANQVIAQNFFMQQEIDGFTRFFDQQLKEMIGYQNSLGKDFGGVISPIYDIRKKHRMWNKVKKAIKSIYNVRDILEKGRLFCRALEILVEKKWAFFNGPRQMWVDGEEMDTIEQIQHPTINFFEFKLEENELKAISSEAAVPSYKTSVDMLRKKLEYLSNLTEEVYQRERDLLTAYQTEFGLYAVWFAIIALVVAVISLFLSK